MLARARQPQQKEQKKSAARVTNGTAVPAKMKILLLKSKQHEERLWEH
jgi:hypothetical protein